MNPSASGWIKKHLPYFLSNTLPTLTGEMGAYIRFRESGFIYGTSLSTFDENESNFLKWTEAERTKVNLFDALVFTYYDTIDNAHENDCIESILNFYRLLNTKQQVFFSLSFGKGKPKEQLEKVLAERIQTNEHLLQKNFSHLITNALLYIDILAYDHYLLTNENPFEYAQKLENILTNTIWLALQQKEEKNSYDELLLKLFERSLRYKTTLQNSAQSIEELSLNAHSTPLEAQYILDLVCLTLWDDQVLDHSEYIFAHTLAKKLYISPDVLSESLSFTISFLKEHRKDITFLNYSNPVKHFYEQTSRTVSTLVLRNQKRLIEELKQSKDLVRLLGASTVRDLNTDERKVVRNQLLDICKSVPSLAIFILPGGTLLLPILMKFIPKLLPSAFNENLEQ